jgi:hypothetical protein
MEFMDMLALVFLIACFVGAVISIGYTIRILHSYVFDFRAKEENVSLLQAARSAATHLQTPIFGEAAWFAMIGWLILALLYRAGWHNLVKLAMQLEWRQEDSDQERC